MGDFAVNNLDGFIAGLQAQIDKFEQQCVEASVDVAFALQRNLFSRTPVWSGDTLRNYQWGVGSMPSGAHVQPSGSLPSSPYDFSEENREPNENSVLQEMESLYEITKLQNLLVTNNIDPQKWDLIDAGDAPMPGRGRNPGGVSTLALQDTRTQLGGLVK